MVDPTVSRLSERPGRMSTAEYKILREHLGVTGDHLAAMLGVSPRQARKWENGSAPVPAGITAQLGTWVEDTTRTVDDIVAAVRDGRVTDLVTYRTDETFAAAHPDSPWTAGWHRAVVARVLEAAPHARVRFAEDD